MDRKGVIEMMETFMVLFIIFLLIGIGMYYFFTSSVKEQQTTIKEVCMLDATQMLASVIVIPDIQCSMHSRLEPYCADTAKLLYIKDSARAKALGELGACKKKIVFQRIYPKPEAKNNGTECTPNEPEACGQWTIFEPKPADIKGKASRTMSTPVSLYYPDKREFGMGRLLITTYTS